MVGAPVLVPRPAVGDAPIEVDARSLPDPNRWWANAVGGMFIAGGLAHLLLLSLKSAAEDRFADASYGPFVTHTWRSVLVPNVYYLIPPLAVFEVAVGAAVLSRRYRIAGITGATAFNAALMLFGWGFFIWSLPVLALLCVFAVRETTVSRRTRPGAR